MAIVSSDVLGWWDLQTGSGSSAVDASTSPTNGTITSATWTTGGPTNLPNGLNFSGSSQYVTVAKDYDFASSEGCVAFWMNITTRPTGTGENYIIDNGSAGGEMSVFLKGPTNNANYLSSRSRFTSDRDINSSSSVSTSTLYHVAYNFKSGAMELFLNGVSVGTNTNAGTLTDTGGNLVFGGLNSLNAGFFFTGKLHQVNLFNRVLTSTEIGTLYNSGLGKTYLQAFPILTSYEGSNDDFENSGTTGYNAMGFQVQANGNCTGFSIYGSRGNTASGTFSASVYSGADPSGTLIATQTFTTASTLTAYTGSPVWNDVTFTTPFSLTAGTQYYLRIIPLTGSTNDEVRWSTDTTSPTYAYGYAWSSTGGAWSAQTTRHKNFRIYGTATVGSSFPRPLRLLQAVRRASSY